MPTYYNDNDAKCCAWLRELIADGLLPPGWVDNRSIADVKPHEIAPYQQKHFFAGIGGWAFALRLAGWPDQRPVSTGSCPCQPFSCSGKGLGIADPRHLWPHFRSLITFGEVTTVFGEQVASPLGRDWFSGVRADLEALGYGVGGADLCAAGVGSPQRRQRLYWVAHPAGGRRAGADWPGLAQHGSRAPGEAGGVADAMHDGGAEHVHQSRGWCSSQQEHAADGEGTDEGLDNPNGPRRKPKGQRPEGEARDKARLCGSEPRCNSGGLANADHDRLGSRSGDKRGSQETWGECRDDSQRRGGADRLGDAAIPGCEERPQHGGEGSEGNEGLSLVRSGALGFWSECQLIACTDGHTRRIPVEPRLQPLAFRIPHRVALLRGAGNSICAELAALFVQSCF